MRYTMRLLKAETCNLYEGDVWVVERWHSKGDAVLVATYRDIEDAFRCLVALLKSIESQRYNAMRNGTQTPAPEYSGS